MPRTVTVYRDSRASFHVYAGAGSTTPLANVLEVETNEGPDMQVPTGRFVLAGGIIGTGLDFWTQIRISMGATRDTEVDSLIGFIPEEGFDYQADPRGVTVHVEHPMGWLKDTFAPENPTDPEDPDEPGISLVGGGAGATDRAQVIDLLTRAGLGSWFSAGQIGGNPHLLGTEAGDDALGSKAQFVWKKGQSAMAYIEELDKVSRGFRTFGIAATGMIVRRQISAVPVSGTRPITFTEGVDIFKGARATHTTTDAFNACIFEGYDDGTGKIRAFASAAHPHPRPGQALRIYRKSSPLVEQQSAGDPTKGFDADSLAIYYVQEKNHIKLRSTFTTPRDDYVEGGLTVGYVANIRQEIAQNMTAIHCRRTWRPGEGFTAGYTLQANAAVGAGGASLPITLQPGAYIGAGQVV
jgi:hypothetical protein